MKRRKESSHKVLHKVALAALLWCWLPGSAVAAERITGFTSDIAVAADGSFVVTETIEYDFGSAERHGIYRTLPLTHPQPAATWYKKRFIEIDEITATRAGDAVPLQVSESRKELTVRLGDPKTTITGQHIYTISYRVTGGLSVYETESPELYWNVTGSEWDVPIQAATATVTAPPGAVLEQHACYAGAPGTGVAGSDTCVVTHPGDAVVFTAGELRPGEELTIAQALRAERVATPVLERISVWYWLVPLLLLGIAWYGRWLYQEKTLHKQGGRSIVAQYEPYPDVLPMYAGVLLDGTLHARDITAGLLQLATEGFITITKTDRTVLWLFNTDDYEVQLQRSPAEVPTAFHRTLLELLFGQSVMTMGSAVRLSELKRDQTQQRRNYKELQRLRQAIRDDLVARGFFERSAPYRLLAGVGLVVLVIVYVGTSMTGAPWVVAVVAGVATFVVAAAVLYRRRTKRGYDAYYHLAGFKEFLSVTGKDRFAFHNAPEKSPQQFLAFLPYAVAFGVEQEWSEVFADITIPQPEWYHSQTGGTFSATALTSDLDAFASSFTSSTGSSGSSGGGSAGGGAGGGGGGSW